MATKTCEKCRFWIQASTSKPARIPDGHCHRFPKPEAKRADGWCGEFKRRLLSR